MMTGHAFQFVCSLAVALFMSAVCITTSIHAQSTPGFLSLDCGTSTATPYEDAIMKFKWESDDSYTLTGNRGDIPFPVNSTTENYEALKSFRYFPDRRQKHCYELPTTTSNISFLIRAMFFHGGSSELVRPIRFNVSVNATTWFSVQYLIDDSSEVLSTSKVFEGIFFSPGSIVNFCLVPITGVPFISSLEIRELDPNGRMYSYPDSQNFYLSNLRRWNCGAPLGSNNIRFPDDPFDRLWYTPGVWAGYPKYAATRYTTTTSSNINNVPPKVMQTAWMNNSGSMSYYDNSSYLYGAVTQVYAAVYFEEIDVNVSSGSRAFGITLNGVQRNRNATAINAGSMRYYWDILIPEKSITFKFNILPSSNLGPVVNAMELYSQVEMDSSTTATQDVNGLKDLQRSFNLTTWLGDPCYPLPWDWVNCTTTSPRLGRVTKLLLSNMGISGIIPTNISQLDALMEIHMDNNNLTGHIPDSLGDLVSLTLLSLNDNHLSGEVPPRLRNKPGFYFNNNDLLLDQGPKTSRKRSISLGALIGIIVGGGMLLILVSLGVLWCLCHKKSIVEPPRFMSSKETKNVSYERVRQATQNFKNKIGEGSYGAVYHGWLDHIEVAVKVNKGVDVNRKFDERSSSHNIFRTEVDILNRIHHLNLVSLVGYCDNGTHFILIYEFQSNGTLREWLYDEVNKPQRGFLNWEERLRIAKDAAQGLEYLHKGCNPSIIHHDVKSSNILLDSNKIAKVADFGFSKTISHENPLGPYSIFKKGTQGYLDPEYEDFGRWTHKSDVYSFGVILAEIISGRPPITKHEDGGGLMLVEWLKDLVNKNDLFTLVDPNLRGNFNNESMWMMVDIVHACILPEAKRPDIAKVLRDITIIIELENQRMMNFLNNTLNNE